jgi:hypothetical protein
VTTLPTRLRAAEVENQMSDADPRAWKIHRNCRGAPRWYQRWLEAWWIICGEWSLHRAWQAGHDHGASCEYRRLIKNGAWRAEVGNRA